MHYINTYKTRMERNDAYLKLQDWDDIGHVDMCNICDVQKFGNKNAISDPLQKMSTENAIVLVYQALEYKQINTPIAQKFF